MEQLCANAVSYVDQLAVLKHTVCGLWVCVVFGWVCTVFGWMVRVCICACVCVYAVHLCKCVLHIAFILWLDDDSHQCRVPQ